MLNYPCKVLLIEDEANDVDTVRRMLGEINSAFFGQGFKLTCAETLSDAQAGIVSRRIRCDLARPSTTRQQKYG